MIYLGLGSNLGDRRSHLGDAIVQLKKYGFAVKQISPVVESPALLKSDAKPEWNQPYLNLVVGGSTKHAPHELLALVKKIEQALGRDLNESRWSPRPIDIDLLLWSDQKINTDDLIIPHPEVYKRTFVITPLMHLAPHLVIPGINFSPLQISQQIRPIPLWMGIVNLTPDSFSDGGVHHDLDELEGMFEQWIDAGVHIIDIGAESTRPNAESISSELEKQRLEGVLVLLKRMRDKHLLMPLISIDTHHLNTAKYAVEKGVDWVNDVTGLRNPAMLDLIREQRLTGIGMHSVSVPVNPKETLTSDRPVEQQLLEWLAHQSEHWQEHGLDTGKIVFDPGVGFGKTQLQNLDIIKSTAALRSRGFRLLIGHSRKSFMNSFAGDTFADRDMETLGLSLAMCEQGVDIIRVHDPLSHIRAYRAWSHGQRY